MVEEKNEKMVVAIDDKDLSSMHEVDSFKAAVFTVIDNFNGNKKEALQAIRDEKVRLYSVSTKTATMRMKANFM